MAYMSDKKWDKIIHELYTRWFAASSPKADYDELCRNAYDTRAFDDLPRRDENDVPTDGPSHKMVYEAYFIKDIDAKRIFDEVCKDFKLTKSQQRDLGWIYLGHGPYNMPEDYMWDDIQKEKFDRLVEKIDRGDVIIYDDLPHTTYDMDSTKEKPSKIDLMRLYEYNRKSHPYEASKYFELLRQM